jgi:hypothetical protein
MTLIWFGYIVRLSQRGGEGGGLLLAQIVSTCLRGGYRMGGGGAAPSALNPTQDNLKAYRNIVKYSKKLETLPFCNMYYLLPVNYDL